MKIKITLRIKCSHIFLFPYYSLKAFIKTSAIILKCQVYKIVWFL